jgi:nucleotidyltransferase substrate binding protein (TIGR01987 family)
MIDISSLENAIAQLETSLKYSESDLAKQDEGIAKQFRAAAIQAFEFTYEISHKMLKRYLKDSEASPEVIEELNFSDLIRTGFAKGLLLGSWDKWRTYRKARGITSHTYFENQAIEVFLQIPEFLKEAKYLRDQINARQSTHN